MHAPSSPRDRILDAQLYLLFTPTSCGARDPLEVLEAALAHVDVVQVRPKRADSGLDPSRVGAASETTDARELFEWCERVLDLARTLGERAPLIVANDRVDVARSLADRGLAGVHLGQEDCPIDLARAVLGDDALIGLSTHDMTQVALAQDLAVDYLGFGPIHATATKGYVRGLGSEAAWIGREGSSLPVFPIGGITAANVGELAEVGRAAVSSAILGAQDPALAARTLRKLLERDAN
jgi:thiamine-phosphate pyrophosphorylase